MTVHKLSAGDGYTYLTRQVASADERRPSGQALADYYTARGNPPGVWVGAGAVELGLAGSVVSEAQMRALFGEGCHPDRDSLIAAGVPEPETRLGRPYRRYRSLPPTGERVAARVAEAEAELGRSLTAGELEKVRVEESQRVRHPVAGFDLVFTPVKSASLLWALGGPAVRAAVEDAHHEAVMSTIGWIETHAAFTRTGRDGVAQVDVTGLICAAFDHRESRAADPDLHTHVAVSNKVRGLDGGWRALDARGLHALGVAASERYNTRFEDALSGRLGVGFVERAGGRGKRPVREVDGVPVALIRHFSRRRAAIEAAYGDLVSVFRDVHGRDPDRSTQLRLAQQATLQTRDGKPPGRTLAEQVADWTDQATAVLGRRGLDRMLDRTTGQDRGDPFRTASMPDADLLDRLARQVLTTVSTERSTWTRWNVHAETERVLRGFRSATAEGRDALTEQVVARALSPDLSIRISAPELVAEPDALRRASDGQSVFVAHGAERYTTGSILDAEESLLAAARCTTPVRLDPMVADAALAVHQADRRIRLDDGQRRLVAAFTTSPASLVLGIGAAGAGKTTAMQAVVACWSHTGGRVIPLAASSKAADVLGVELGMRAENLHKFLHDNHAATVDGSQAVGHWFTLAAGDLVLVDEAGMAGTLQLADLTARARAAGAVVRLLGDPAQLAAVEAGGALRLLEIEAGAVRLDRLHRFSDPGEADATLQLRVGDTAALDFYVSRDRIRSGSRDAMAEAAYDGWAADVRNGATSVLLAATGTDVAALNARARLERVTAGQVEAAGVDLHDGNIAGVGDWVVTRTNLRGLTCRGGRDWVKNGDRWQVEQTHRDHSLKVRHQGHNGTVRLPASYVADQVELAYAATVHRVQGATVDTAHPLVTPEMTREALYVASTRARDTTTWYVAGADLLDPGSDHEPDPPRTAVEVLTAVLGRSGAEDSATGTLRQVQDEASALPQLVARYHHARSLAARQVLTDAAPPALGLALAQRVLSDPAAGQLADALANTVTQSGCADPVRLLREVAAMEPLTGARSVAAVLAARVHDNASGFGYTRARAGDGPLPWLDPPDVGHPGWCDYLTTRARLISERAEHLGSLSAAYREQYQLDHLPARDLGDPPQPGTSRHRAYLTAQAEQRQPAPLIGATPRAYRRRLSTYPTRPAPVPVYDPPRRGSAGLSR